MSKFACSSKNCEKLEKSLFLLKMLNLRVKRGRRVPSKNCDFCNVCCLFLRFLQKLRKLGEIAVFAKITYKIQELKDGERCPAKTAISPNIAKTMMGEIAIFAKITKFMSQRREKTAQQKMRFLRFLRLVWTQLK